MEAIGFSEFVLMVRKDILDESDKAIIFSDIDDTILYNGNKIFKNILEHYNDNSSLPLILSTARQEYHDYGINEIREKINKPVILLNSFYPIDKMGNLGKDVKILTRSFKRLSALYGKEKYINFLKFKPYFPKLKYIFYGDNTQGDEIMAYLMIKDGYEGNINRVYSSPNLDDNIKYITLEKN